MVKLLKLFAKGLLNTVLLPVYLLVWVLYAIYCMGSFFVMFFVDIIEYFQGKNTTGDLLEDLEAKKIVLEKEKADEQAKEAVNIMYQNALAQAAMNQAVQNNPQPSTPVQPFGVNSFAPTQNAPAENSSTEQQPVEKPVNSEENNKEENNDVVNND